MNFQQHILSNGLRVILAPTKNTKALTLLVLVASGSKYEPKKLQGISHFLEHLFFKGSQKYPTSLKLAQTLDAVGALYNAFTGKEYTGFYIKTASRHQLLTFDVLSDMLLNPLLKENEAEREKGVIEEELKMYLDVPMSYVGNLFERLLYGDAPAGRDIIGTKKSIRAISAPAIRDFFKTHYGAANTFLIVSGDLEPQKTLTFINQFFSSFAKIPAPVKKKTKEKQTAPQILSWQKKTDQTHLCLGVRTYRLAHAYQYELMILATILGGNMSSRLFIKIRDKLGLAYYVRTETEFYTDSGYLVTQAGIDHQNLEKVVKLILREYQRLKKEKIKKTELNKVKEYLKGLSLLHLETSEEIADFLGKQQLLLGKIETPEEKFKKLDRVTPESLMSVAQNIFQPRKLNLALISPLKTKKSLKKILII